MVRWAGPCSLMRPVILKVKAKLQISDQHEDIIQYATACSDSISALECFKNICTPIFLFIASGSKKSYKDLATKTCFKKSQSH